VASSRSKLPPSAADAIKSGDRRRGLEALRDTLADHLLLAQPNVVAQIAGRLQAVLSELASLPQAEAVSRIDEVRQRREKRRPA
jgi:hypothetical protein